MQAIAASAVSRESICRSSKHPSRLNDAEVIRLGELRSAKAGAQLFPASCRASGRTYQAGRMWSTYGAWNYLLLWDAGPPRLPIWVL